MRNPKILIDQHGRPYQKPIIANAMKMTDMAAFRAAHGLTDSAANGAFKMPSLQEIARSYRMLDSAASTFFLRELEYIKKEVFDVLYEELPFRKIFPVSNEAGPGKKYITYRVYDKVGQAILISNFADDLPRADAFAAEYTIPIRWLGGSYGYNLGEIQGSRRVGGEPLDQRRAEASARGMEQAMNDLSIYGTSDATTMPGLFNNAYIPKATAAVKGSGSTIWAGATPDEILADVNNGFSAVNVNSLMIEEADTLVLPTQQWNYIASTPRSINSDTTIMGYLVANSPFLKGKENIMKINELAGAATDIGGFTGNDSNDVMWFYKKDPRKLQLEIPVEFTSLPPQERNLEWVVNCYSNIAGVNIYFPGSMLFVAGI